MEPNTNEATAPKRLKTGGKKPLVMIGIIFGILVILAGAAYVGVCAYAKSLDTFYPCLLYTSWLLVFTKRDMAGGLRTAGAVFPAGEGPLAPPAAVVSLSSVTGEGLEDLGNAVAAQMCIRDREEYRVQPGTHRMGRKGPESPHILLCSPLDGSVVVGAGIRHIHELLFCQRGFRLAGRPP